MSLPDPPTAWREILGPVLAGPAGQGLADAMRSDAAAGVKVLPPCELRFRALEIVAPEAVRVVILGQDPYHGAGQAHGLAFSVPQGVKHPPSLRNIFTELAADCGIARPASGDLIGWARQGVLLLNTTLSVAEGRAGSHVGKGWELVSDAIILEVARSAKPTVFILWGGHAQAKAPLIRSHAGARHLLIESPHPSPLSSYRGFFGSRPFSRANAFLQESGRGAIDWSALDQ